MTTFKLKQILRHRRPLGLAAILAVLALSAALALAQTGGGFDLSFSTTEPGTTSTGGNFSLSGAGHFRYSFPARFSTGDGLFHTIIETRRIVPGVNTM